VSRAIAVLNASQIVTLRGPARARVGPEMRELGVVENGALLAIDGLIRAVGRREDVEPQIPDDAAMTDLESWHRFETANPDIFRGMYQFWVQNNA